MAADYSCDDPVRIYLNEIAKIPPLTKDEETELVQHVQSGDREAESARARLAESNLAMVVAVAQRYSESGIHLLDLIQKGNDGLLVALKTFTGDSGESFAAHASACVNRAIADAVASSTTQP